MHNYIVLAAVIYLLSPCRLCSKSPYPTPPATKMAETTKPDFSAEVSPDAGCLGKPLAPEKEIQPKVAANVA